MGDFTLTLVKVDDLEIGTTWQVRYLIHCVPIHNDIYRNVKCYTRAQRIAFCNISIGINFECQYLT